MFSHLKEHEGVSPEDLENLMSPPPTILAIYIGTMDSINHLLFNILNLDIIYMVFGKLK